MATAQQATIIKRVVEDGHDGHHGGAWKVAYADFMTAMMAFFLLLWILSSSDEQKLRGIAEYFTDATEPGGQGVLDGATLGPPGTLTASNGAVIARGSERGKEDQTVIAKWEVRDSTPTSEIQDNVPGASEGEFQNPANGDTAQLPNAESNTNFSTEVSEPGAAEQTFNIDGAKTTEGSGIESTDEGRHTEDQLRFDALEVELKQAMQANPDLRPLMENVVFERTAKGLRIQVIDQQGKPMFASGSAKMLDATRVLMSKLGQSLSGLPNQMVITGHTDAVPFSGRANYDNWDLSTDRANATRRVLLESGVDSKRLISVTGKAATDPLLPEQPKNPSNRRITLMLQYAEQAKTASVSTSSAASETNQLEQSVSGQAQQAEASEKNDMEIPTRNATPLLDNTTLENLRNVLR